MMCGAIISIDRMRLSQGWKNYTLLILLTTILVFAALQVVFTFLYLRGIDGPINLISAIEF